MIDRAPATALDPEPDRSPVPSWSGAHCPRETTLDGRTVVLEALAPRHADGLDACLHDADAGDDPMLWEYMPYGPLADRAAVEAWVAERVGGADPFFYAIVPRSLGCAAGAASLMRCTPADGTIEIGNVWMTAGLQRTAAASEAIMLMAEHAFEVLGHRRLEWKCDAANARSRRAAARFGFTFEGVFRQHMVIKGRNRDTAWFAITDGEWPALRAAYRAWLAPENFDEHGGQRRTLAELRTA